MLIVRSRPVAFRCCAQASSAQGPATFQLTGCVAGMGAGLAADWATGAGMTATALCISPGTSYAEAFWKICGFGHLGMILGALMGCAGGFARLGVGTASRAVRGPALTMSTFSLAGMLIAMRLPGALWPRGGDAHELAPLAAASSMLVVMILGHSLGLAIERLLANRW